VLTPKHSYCYMQIRMVFDQIPVVPNSKCPHETVSAVSLDLFMSCWAGGTSIQLGPVFRFQLRPQGLASSATSCMDLDSSYVQS
jgi:hypothetical protein